MAPFSLTWRAFHLPKKGHTLEDYEDAFAGNADQGRFAVADGASESAFAGIWANALVEAYVRSPRPWSAWLPAARKRWRVQGQKRELPWYAETKFQEGDFAAFLGIAFNGDRWLAEAVGDSCLFRIRDGRLAGAFPVRHSSDFSNRPSLLGSRLRGAGQPRAHRFRMQGDCRPGDVFFLMTDAIAQWFLKKAEEGRRPWEELQAIPAQEQFVPWLEKLRENKELRNDDVTLMCIKVQNS
jgi:serine/threonine protein phosphatase PrpC